MNFKLRTATGIYVGTRHVYVAQLKGTLFGAHLVKCGRTEIQPSNAAGPPGKYQTPTLVEAIKKVLRENNITSKRVITALPGKDILIRYFQMPKIPKSEWEDAIRFEAKKYIPFKIEELLWDFRVGLPKGRGIEKTDVTFAAVKIEVAKKYLALLEEAGLKVLALEPAPFSLVRMLTLSKQLPKDKPVAIVDIDEGVADINIVKNGICFLTRDVSLPLERDIIFDNLLNEIRMSLDYYEKLFPAEMINKILLCGEAELKDWDKRFTAELKIPVENASLAKAVKIKKAVPALNMSIAIGLGLRGTARTVSELDLSRPRKPQAKIWVTKWGIEFTPEVGRAIIQATALSCVVLLGLYFLMNYDINKRKEQLEQIVSSGLKLDSARAPLSQAKLEELEQELSKKLHSLASIIDKRTIWTSKFNELPKILPEGAWLTELSCSEQLSKNNKFTRSLKLKGVVYNQDPTQEVGIITNFVSDLKANKEFALGFQAITLDSVTSAEFEGEPVKRFEISCRK